MHALAQPVFVLGMECGAAADRLQNIAHALVVLDQQRAGRGAHEHLDAAGAGQPLQRRELMGVLARAPDIEREVAVHAVMPARDLVGQRRGVGGGRLGVGHLEHRGDAAQHRAARAGFQVLLVRQARLAQMHMAVDHARQHVQAPAVDHLGGGRSDIADRGDPAAGDGQIAHALAVLVDDRAALQDQVVAARHPHLHQFQFAPLSGQHQRLTFPEATRNRMKAALLPDRGVVKVAGADRPRLPQRAADDGRHQGHARAGAVRRAADAAGQDHRRLHRRRGAGRGRRRLLPRLPAGAGAGAGREAQFLQAARQGDLRGSVRGAGRDGGLGRRRHDRIRPGLCRPAAAGARPAHHAAAASGQGGRRRSRRRAVRGGRLRGAPHRAGRAARRARLHLWRRLPARDRHGPACRRRFRQGLLRRPGGGVAHGASRHRAQPHRADRRPETSRRTPASR